MPTRMSLGPMIDSPGRYDTLETWERFLAELERMPPSTMRNLALDDARKTVQLKRAGKIPTGQKAATPTKT